MDNKTKPDIQKIANEIVSRGNDVEIRACKDGLKVLEVTRKVVLVISNPNANGR